MKEAIEKLVAVMDQTNVPEVKAAAAFMRVAAELEGQKEVPDDVWLLFKPDHRVPIIQCFVAMMLAHAGGKS